jgi:hypothetical protein
MEADRVKSARFPAHSAPSVYTSGQMLEKCPKNYHFFPLFGAPGGTTRCQSSIGKSFRAKQIGPAE